MHLFSQVVSAPCAFDDIRQMYREKNLIQLVEREAAQERRISQWLSNHAQTVQANARYFPNGPDFIIPVVVHIVHNGEALGTGANISYAQVKSQIDALNAGFSNYSATANYYQPSAGLQFAGLPSGVNAVDTRIRFCLATIAPVGTVWSNAAEPGVMRYNNPSASRHEYSEPGQTALANLTQPGGIFSPDAFMNIWVVSSIRFGPPVNSGDCPGIQGYATIAGYNGPGARLIEGVVIRSDVFGDNTISGNNFNLQPLPNPACIGGISNNQANQGKIAVHEVGHFLGLYHTFHECAGSNAAQCATTGDFVCDTNPCDQPGVNAVCGMSDMPENFMYYSDDAIRNTFTAGQRSRMHAMLNTIRPALVSEANVLASGVLGSNGCFAAAVMAEFTSPANFCVRVPALFSNINSATGSNQANQWQWTVLPATGVTISDATASSTNITFTVSGSYTVRLTASLSGTQVTMYERVIQVVACEVEPCRKSQVKWIFGWGNLGIDFSDGQPLPSLPSSSIMASDGNQESYITESDPVTGELIFYSNGFHVYDAGHNRISTTALHPIAGGTFNSNAQIVSIPFPGRSREYLLIIPTKGWDDPPILSVANDYLPAFIHHINMNGTPSVTAFVCSLQVTAPAGEAVNFNTWSYNEQIEAIPHANGHDYWIIFPVKTVSNKIFMVSFLVNAAGITQKAFSLVANSGGLLPYGFGLVANKAHNRVALKFIGNGFSMHIAGMEFNHLDGSFSNPQVYNVSASNIPEAGGMQFYDDTHIYLSRTTNGTRGMADMDLLTGTVTSFSGTNDYGRLTTGPDGLVYVIAKPSFQGPGSVALARIDRVAGLPVVNTVITGAQLSGSLPITLGANFWNLPEQVHCPPPAAMPGFSYTRINCNSFQFSVNNSLLWNGYTVIWNFGDGSPVVTSTPGNPPLHVFATPGTYQVSLQLQVTGCAGTALVPALPVSQTIIVADPNVPLPIAGPVTVCAGSHVHELPYSSVQNASAGYLWTMTGDGHILQPSSGTGISQVLVLFGQNPGIRTINVQLAEGGCVQNGSITVTVTLPGQANAGQDGSVNVCNSLANTVILSNVIIGAQPGGFWIRTSGSGGIFNAASGTFTPSGGATTSIFQYIIPANAGCSLPDTSQAIVQIIPSAEAGLDGSASVCNSSNALINLYDLISGESSGGTWQRVTGTGGIFDAANGTFQINATATGSNFRYIITGTNGCSNDTSMATVIILIQPNAGLDGELVVCDLNSPAIILQNVISGQQAGGVWTRISGTGGNFNASNGTFSPPFITGTSRFRYTVSGNAPCTPDESIATINIGQLETFADKDKSLCFNEKLDLRSLYNVSGYTIVKDWSVNGQLVPDPALVDQSGLYELVVGNGQACFDTIRVTVIVSSAIQVSVRQDTIAVSGLPLTLQATGGVSYLWTWYPNDAVVSSSSVRNPVVRLKSDEYIFYVEVSDQAGCKAYDSLRIKVFKGPAYYIPNAFTPNGDGLNDLFSALPVGIKSTEWFRLYNRYGQMIFETSNPGIGWDGRFKGKPQDPGVYVWMIRGTGYNNKLIEMKGTVMLIR